MNDLENLNPPSQFEKISAATETIGFKMACEMQTGALLRTLAASKPGGQFLEIGTGTGVSTSWILQGMDRASHLTSIEQDDKNNAIAREYLGDDPRVTFITADAGNYLTKSNPTRFDFIFADTFPGKFYLLDEALGLLAPGALYIVDDLLPQATWPNNHATSVANLIATLESRQDLRLVKLNWASGIIIAAKL